MIPESFEYHVPRTLEEAAQLIAQFGDEGKLLAGGHSLVPLMKLRLASPRHVVDIARLDGLRYILENDGRLEIGALTTHYRIESSTLLKEKCPLLPLTASEIGDVQVRNKGTLGGSLAHADPAAEPDILLAVTEIVTNTLTYGYQDKPGWVEVLIRRKGDSLQVVLRDKAAPFDPTQVPDPDVHRPLKERLPGGLGIYLARHFVDRIAYRTTPEYGNEIMLVKNGILGA